MSNADAMPPPHVREAAAIVETWVKQREAAAKAPEQPALSAADRFDLQRRQQFDKSRADEPNLRKARS
ncbi:MAG: hypothetical protein ACLQJ0_26270 [Steroidobacteraceae bacterium]|jgi:hypothetical protein